MEGLKVKHTSTKWGTSSDFLAVHSVGNNPFHDGIICDLRTWPNEDVVKANATLIAAAPELLEALKDALAWINGDGEAPVHIIESAIARAEGRA